VGADSDEQTCADDEGSLPRDVERAIAPFSDLGKRLRHAGS
jgi:hypothetical protein